MHRRVGEGWPKAVRRVDELGGVGQSHGFELSALQVFAAEGVGVRTSHKAIGAWLVADALDEDQPARAEREQMIAQILSPQVPVGQRVLGPPIGGVWLVYL